MNKILVTGGLGNIGVRIIDELLLHGYQVRCLDLKNRANEKTARRYHGAVSIM
ncbi:MAG: hypothetical protein R3208_15230 [Ketobacteraceae bacterium]|nr:hypothetical protein [Ketobacteraceae bacterium]